MAKKNYTKGQLIYWLQDFAEELGETPTQLEVDNEPSMPSRHVYMAYFGTYSNACRTAGLKVNKHFYTDEELLEKLKKICDELRRAPKSSEIEKRDDLPCFDTYRKRFGSWDKACQKVGYKSFKEKQKLSKQKMMKKLKEFAEDLGRTPTSVEVKRHKKLPSPSFYRHHFGSYSKACEKLGLVPYERGTNLDCLPEEEKRKRRIK